MVATYTAHTARNLRRGQRLGKYQLQSQLGNGAFSRVWKARDLIEKQWVALKIPYVSEDLNVDEDELLREIQINAALEHRNILRVKTADKIKGLYVIATELGVESLEDRLTRRVSTRKALSYIKQVLEGLAFAHGRKIIHRDIKPSNIMLFDRERVKIADFGLAVISHKTILSASGSGTVAYAAPEQMGGYPSRASDVFSLGLLSYQLLTGAVPKWPFEWPFERTAVLRQRVPEEVIKILRKALHFDYRKRYGDAAQMLAAFEKAEPAIEKFLAKKVKEKSKPKSRKSPRRSKFKAKRKS